LNVKKEAATIGDTLFMDFLRVTDMYANTGTNLAKLRMGPMCPYNVLEGRIYNAPATCPNWTIDPQDPTFRRLGPDVRLSPSDFPFEISSAYFVITPESTFEWKKGTQDGTGGTTLNANPLTDKTTTSWFVNSPAEANDYYYLKVRYNIEGMSPESCVLDASVRVDIACSVGEPSSTPTVCIGVPITPITIATTDITGIGTPVNLPASLTASFANNTITISGTPTVSGTFNYSIPLASNICGPMNATGTITVNAQGAPCFPTIIYDPNGAPGVREIFQKTDECQIILAPVDEENGLYFHRQDFDFVEWNTDPSGDGTSYFPGSEYCDDEDIVLYAIWKRNCNTPPIKITYKGKKPEPIQD
jgi:hypothetical protein